MFKRLLLGVAMMTAVLVSPSGYPASDLERHLGPYNVDTDGMQVRQKFGTTLLYDSGLEWTACYFDPSYSRSLIVTSTRIFHLSKGWDIPFLLPKDRKMIMTARQHSVLLKGAIIPGLGQWRTGKGIGLGDTADQVIRTYGQPDGRSKSDDGSTWLDYKHRYQFASFRILHSKVIEIGIGNLMPPGHYH